MFTVDTKEQVFHSTFSQTERPYTDQTQHHDAFLAPSPSYKVGFREIATMGRA